jgi:hypothetical protein
MIPIAKDLMQGNFGKWKRKLSARQIERFDRIACNWLQTYGYETSVTAERTPALLPAAYWKCDNKVRRLLRFDYWRDNFYKATVRGRDAVR